MRPSRTNFIVLFLIIIFFELSLMAYLIANHRMVLGHDGFEWFVDQWYFVNGKVSYHEVPLWTPFVTHGQVTSYTYNRLGMFSNILMLFSGWIKHINFLPLYYLGLFFDKFILLTGTWLLARRYFKNPLTVFFVASTVMASTITLTQITHTILLIYCLPLTLYLLHRFFDSWKWKWLFATVFLMSIVSINIYYFISLFPLAVFLYFLVVFFITPVKNFKMRGADIVWIIGMVFVLALMAQIFILEHDPLLSIHSPNRPADGHIPLDIFLMYGGGIGLFKWWELFLGISQGWDNTVYLGLLAVPLIFIGIASKNKNKYPFLIGAAFFLLFSLATPVTVLAYYFWPLMTYFRHIGLVTPLIKFYLCFLAGFGFEELFDIDKSKQAKEVLYKSLFSAVLLYLNGLFLCQLVINANLGTFFLDHLSSSMKINLSEGTIDLLYYTARLSMLGALIFLARPFINFSKYASSYTLILIFFHLIVIYGYAYEQMQERSFLLKPKEYALMGFQKFPFVHHRQNDEGAFPRAQLVRLMGGAVYDESYNFTFSDMVRTKYRSDISLIPYDQLSHLFNDPGSPVFLKLVGSSEDKVQFFSHAYPLKNVVDVIQNKDFSGDMLFYSSIGQSRPKGDQLKGLDLSQDQRLNIPYKVLSFSPNQIVIDVDQVAQPGTWMEYCDTWHSHWKAEVNGRPQKVFLGNVAYKAIALQKGKNIVRFYFESNFLTAVYYYFMIGSFIWMGLLILLLMTFPV